MASEVPPSDSSQLTYERDVSPVLAAHCFRCHGGEATEAGLDLRRRFSMVAGGDSGPAIVPGSPAESLLMEMIDEGLMPPEDEPPLDEADAELLRRWIASGAAIAGQDEPPLETHPAESEGGDRSAQDHWSFQAVKRASLPPVSDTRWMKTPIDAFVLAALEARQWGPAPEASRTELIRRVYFDLTGLPPTPAEVTAFCDDATPGAYARVVDRLLASPHYGERWAQHWLDVVRFAETEGFEYDRHLPDAWRYRDYVIESLNADKPFDRFVFEQIAGDELAPDDAHLQSAAILHRLGPVRRNAGNPDIALSRNEVLTERTNIIGEAFLGLSVGCARCHNHKLEPISQKDYYRLQAYFAATEEYDISLASTAEQEAWNRHTEAIQGEIEALQERASQATGEDKLRLEQQVAELQYKLPPPLPTIPSIRNNFEERTAIHVLRRGIWEQKGVVVGPRPPSVLVPETASELPADALQPRTELARWISGSAHPLTARVMVNRVWQHHFGTGLVKTANDFGTHGDPPSHPELLDWLAARFVESGWRLKPLHRSIVMSSTYRQTSRPPASTVWAEADPENRLLWHFSRRRLSAEEVRDSMLAVSGRLNRSLGGPSVMVPVDAELVELLYKPSQWNVTEARAEHDRRAIYLIAKRNLRLPFFEAFDAPALQISCPERETSIHAPQALELLNGRLSNQLAQAFARRLEDESRGRPEEIVERAFWLTLGRAATPHERRISLEFLEHEPLEEFALAMFNLNGFVYVP